MRYAAGYGTGLPLCYVIGCEFVPSIFLQPISVAIPMDPPLAVPFSLCYGEPGHSGRALYCTSHMNLYIYHGSFHGAVKKSARNLAEVQPKCSKHRENETWTRHGHVVPTCRRNPG